MSKLRVGVVNYLNALPLWHGLRERSEVELLPDVPSKLVQALQDGRIDVGLIPVIEYFRQPDLVLMPGACIGATGPVKSVLLFHRVPVNEITSVALDPSSRTSNTLVRIVLGDLHHRLPNYSSEPWASLDEVKADAAVMIGDPALEVAPGSEWSKIDLAQAWIELTGLPFVFAAWLARKDGANDALHELLMKAAASGREQLRRIAEGYAAKSAMSTADALDYLERNIRYEFGESQQAGLAEFGRRAAAYDLAPPRKVSLWRPNP